ncbi:MAG: hypothetical protein LBN94_02380 [Puniceicoccales bacterium]|jgi:UDP-N-acetylmuramoyl-tripeptide--D-alanyl-D-alanine ligase|nr:hypothetical protein [Puniceicoccales bacterium]
MKTTIFHRIPNASFYGNFPEEINGFWNDTRTLQPGDCFLALSAQRDGHDFLRDAEKKYASCVIVNRIDTGLSLPQLRVDNVLETAKKLAKFNRKHHTIIAISGSYGKTSTKDMLQLILGNIACATPENLNNELGVILTLSRIKSEKFAIIECGIDHPSEMDSLVDLLHPDISMTTGITPVHVANFKNLDQLVEEKCKILRDTLSRNAVASIGETCLRYPQFRCLAHRCTLVGQSQDVQGFQNFTQFQTIGKNQIRLQGSYFRGIIFTLPEMSLGQKENFAHTTTVAKILGLNEDVIQQRILQWQPSKARGEIRYFRGHRVYFDAYNANPMAMEDALRHFDAQHSSDHTGGDTYVLGGMVELGEFSEQYHRRLAQYFHGKCGDLIIAIGVEMEIFYEILRKQNGIEVVYFEEVGAAKDYFQKKCRGRIFVKGSHGYHLEQILAE